MEDKAKGKAIELVDKFDFYSNGVQLRGNSSKQCALISVEERRDEARLYKHRRPVLLAERLKFLDEVEKEIEKL